MSAASELQKAVYDKLIADADVGAKVGDRIYDQMPSTGTYPCVTFGPSDEVPDEAECVDGVVVTLQVDVWSQDNGRLRPCRDIVWVVRQALHEADLSLADPFALSEVRVTSTQTMLDPLTDTDPITAHGIVILTARIEY